MLKEDIRWSRCDIKSVALLPNTISFQEAHENGLKECIFVRNGLITEGSHSNIFFVIDGTLFTHPESNHVLSGITRKNILKDCRGSRNKNQGGSCTGKQDQIYEGSIYYKYFIRSHSCNRNRGKHSWMMVFRGPVTRLIQ